MKKFALLLLIQILLITPVFAQSEPTDVESLCNMETPQSARLFDWSNWKTAEIYDPGIIAEPFHWDASRSIWDGYDSTEPFDQPDDAIKRWSITFQDADKNQQMIFVLQSQTTPDTDYVYVFPTITPTIDAHGKRYGLHPCGAFAANSLAIAGWVEQAYSTATRAKPNLTS